MDVSSVFVRAETYNGVGTRKLVQLRQRGLIWACDYAPGAFGYISH